MPIAAVLRPSISTLLYKIPHCTTRTARTMTSLIALKKGSPEPSPPRPGQTRLYGHRFCPFVYRVRLVLAAKNLEYEIVNVDLKEKPEWLPLKNAASKVPILEKDGNILVESVIISDYLDEAYPSVKLHPDDPLEKAKGRIISENSVNIISQMGKVLKSTAGPVFDDLFQEIANYEKELEKRGTLYFNGKSPGMTDYMIWPSFELVLALPVVYDNANFTLEKFPLIFKWAENMQAHPAVQQTTVGIPLCAQYYSAYREGTQDANVGL